MKLGTVVGIGPGHIVFDVVDHAILLGKLQTLGIDQFALNWIVSFLSNRRQVCRID